MDGRLRTKITLSKKKQEVVEIHGHPRSERRHRINKDESNKSVGEQVKILTRDIVKENVEF